MGKHAVLRDLSPLSRMLLRGVLATRFFLNARLFGYERAEAARFSFLLSIPAISAAGLWKGWELFRAGDPEALEAAALTGGFSAVAGFLAIAFLMAWLRRSTFTVFVGYRILLGVLLLWMIYGGALATGSG